VPKCPLDHWRESVWNDRELTANQKLVLLAMSRYMDHTSLAGARMGHAALRRLTALGKRTVERTTAALVEVGWLKEDHRGGSSKGGRRLASVYRGWHPDWRQPDASSNEGDWRQSDARTGVTESRDWRQSDAPPFKGPRAPRRSAPRPARPTGADSNPRAPEETCSDLPSHIVCTGRWHENVTADDAGAAPCPRAQRAAS
jgi:hypothetical protein